MQIGIVSPGHPRLAKVYNMETGQVIDRVSRVEYYIGASDEVAEVRLTLLNPDVHLVGELRALNIEFDEALLARLVRRWLTKHQAQIPADAQAALSQLLEGYRE